MIEFAAQQHLTKTIEVTRVNVFNIITQYKAIFGEDEHNNTTTTKKDTGDDNKLLYSWLSRKVEQFLKTLDTDLSRGVSALDTVLGQCMYFGMSFSRIGVDFRGQMLPVFLRHINRQLDEGVKAATKEFQLDMEDYTMINRLSSRITHPRDGEKNADAKDVSAPPESLLDFRPLANYCNNILNLLNELRVCAPMAVATHLTRALESSLQNVSAVIGSFYKREQQAFTGIERENFSRYCFCFSYELVPYLQSCVHVLFPVQALASHLGVSVVALQESGVTYLDQSAIVRAIEHLLPVVKPKVIRESEEIVVQQEGNLLEKSVGEVSMGEGEAVQ